MRYPIGALEKLFDPKRGIQCEETFMPKCAELTKFLTPIEGRLYQEAEQERRRHTPMLPEPQRRGRPTYAELKEKYSPPGTHWGLQVMSGSRPKSDVELKHISEIKLSDEAKATMKHYAQMMDSES